MCLVFPSLPVACIAFIPIFAILPYFGVARMESCFYSRSTPTSFSHTKLSSTFFIAAFGLVGDMVSIHNIHVLWVCNFLFSFVVIVASAILSLSLVL